MILLNGLFFNNISQTAKPSLGEYASWKRSTTGKIIRTKQQIVTNERSYTLNVDASQRLRLETLLANALAPFDFIDDSGFSWLISTGVDDSTHAYETGAYFMPPTKLNFAPQSPHEAAYCDSNWNVDITILINATGVAGDSANVVVIDNSGEVVVDNT